MPLIPRQFLSVVFFVYASRADAEAGARKGGIGFFVSVPLGVGRWLQVYAVTCLHCVHNGTMYARVNRLDGGTEVLELDGWRDLGDGSDVAVCPIDVPEETVRYLHLSESIFFDPVVAEEQEVEIGPGDDVFMVGRHFGHEGSGQNIPAMRFGNIAAPPLESEQLRCKGVADQPAYLVDMRSLPGYSGSPVFVFRLYGYSVTDSGEWRCKLSAITPRLLGIDYCHLPTEDGVPSGMAGVIPATKLKELLYLDEFKQSRSREAEDIRKRDAEAIAVPDAAFDEAGVPSREGFIADLERASKRRNEGE